MLLWFSRGRGRGHAVPDAHLVRRLRVLRPNLEIRLASYGTGTATLKQLGLEAVDLKLPETNGIAETTVAAGRLIEALRPEIVVSHEEFAALPAAKIFGTPAIFITDWFIEPQKYAMEVLKFADAILFTDHPGLYAEPPWVRGRVVYAGPVVRDFAYTRADRSRARAELALDQEAMVVSVLPGSWREDAAPILELVAGGFDLLTAERKQLVWVAGADHRLIASRFRRCESFRVIEADWQIDRLMAASDAIVTKATRMTLTEADWMSVPSVSITYGLNPIDDWRSSLFGLNRTVCAAEATPTILAAAIQEAAARAPGMFPVRVQSRAAELLLEAVDATLAAPP